MICSRFKFKMRFIAAIVLAVAVVFSMPNVSKAQTDGTLYVADLSPRASLTSYDPLITAANAHMDAENGAGIALHYSIADLLTPEVASAIERGELKGIDAAVKKRTGDLSNWIAKWKKPEKPVYLLLDCRVPVGTIRRGGPDSFAYADQTRRMEYKALQPVIELGDGLTSPIAAFNTITASKGLFLFDDTFGPKFRKINSAQFLVDGNSSSLASRWVSETGKDEVFVQFTFSRAYPVHRIELYFEDCYPTRIFDVLLRKTENPQLKGEWSKVYSINNNLESHKVIKFDQPVTANAIKVVFKPVSLDESVRLHEIEVFANNAMNREVDLGMDAGMIHSSGIAPPPPHNLIVVRNNRVAAHLTALDLEKSGALMMPNAPGATGNFAILALGPEAIELGKTLRQDAAVSWGWEDLEGSADSAPSNIPIPLPLTDSRVQQSVAKLAGALAAIKNVDGIIIENAGYDGLAFDWGLPAQKLFGRFVGGAIKLPGEVVSWSTHREMGAVVKNGPRYNDWIRWRAQNVTRFVQGISRAVAARGNGAVFGIAIDHSLLDSDQSGLNFAQSGYLPPRAPAWFSDGFAKTGVGGYLDIIAEDGDSKNDSLYTPAQCAEGEVSSLGELSREFVQSAVNAKARIYTLDRSAF